MGVTGIVPAAGLALRLQPLAGSKEVLPVGGRPVMDYLVERLRVAGPRRIRIVTRPEKDDVIRRAHALGAEVVLGHPGTLAASVLLGVAGLPNDEIVLLGFPDSIWEPIDGFVPLLRAVEAGHPIALGLFKTAEPGRSDVVEVAEHATAGPILARVLAKPSAPASTWIWGACAGRAGWLRNLRPEEELAEHLERTARSLPVPVVRLGRILDIGTREALGRADEDPVVRSAGKVAERD